MNKGFLLLGGTITGLSCLGILAILLVVFKHPDGTNVDQTVIQIVTVLSPTIIALVGAFKSIETDKKVSDKVDDVKASIEGNACRIEKQEAKVADLHEQLVTTNIKAEMAAKTAVKLADKVEQLNGK